MALRTDAGVSYRSIITIAHHARFCSSRSTHENGLFAGNLASQLMPKHSHIERMLRLRQQQMEISHVQIQRAQSICPLAKLAVKLVPGSPDPDRRISQLHKQASLDHCSPEPKRLSPWQPGAKHNQFESGRREYGYVHRNSSLR